MLVENASHYIHAQYISRKDSTSSQPIETANTDAARTQAPPGAAYSNPTSRLASETLGFLLRADATQLSGGETPKDRLDSAFQHMIEDAASDPEFAQQQADMMGKYPELVLMHEPFPPNGAPAEEWERFASRTTAAMNMMLDAHKERQAHYDQLVSEGVSGVELYAQMLEFNASQTDYNTRADAYSGQDAGARTQHFEDMAAYLRGLMAEEVEEA